MVSRMEERDFPADKLLVNRTSRWMRGALVGAEAATPRSLLPKQNAPKLRAELAAKLAGVTHERRTSGHGVPFKIKALYLTNY